MGRPKKNADDAPIKLFKERKEWDSSPSGEEKTLCPVCGTEFEQYYLSDTNRYTAFKKCPNCRRKKKGEEILNETEVINITLKYKPHATQQQIHDSKARFKVLVCGNRWGKDFCSIAEGSLRFFECLGEDRPASMVPSVHWWVIAPTIDIAKQNWRYLKMFIPSGMVEYVSNSDMVIQTKYGGLIEIKSAYNKESLVGVGLDIVTITEASRIADLRDVWANVGARLDSPGRGPGGHGGIALINGTPLHMDYYYKMFTFGQAEHPDYDPDWESWRLTTWDNPYMAERGEEIKYVRGVPLTYKERKKRQLGVTRYNQDYLAEFLAGDAKCFPDFQDKCVENLPDGSKEKRKEFIEKWQKASPYKSYIIGYDPAVGDGGDMPAVVVVENDTGNIVRAYDLSGHRWEQQFDRIRDISIEYCHAPVAFSQTGHTTIKEDLEKRGLTCFTMNEQGQNKANFVNRLETVVERGELHVLDDGTEVMQTVINQFNDYSRVEKKSASNAKQIRTVFTNVSEPHDDFVSACYIAWQHIYAPDEALPSVGFLVGMRI